MLAQTLRDERLHVILIRTAARRIPVERKWLRESDAREHRRKHESKESKKGCRSAHRKTT
jgi:hypothetical protein